MAETLQDAWLLLQSGKIEPGREMLLGVCAREPQNFEAHVLGVTEFYREPRRRECGEFALKLTQLAPDCCEFNSFMMLHAAINGNASHYLGPMQASLQSQPRGSHGAALTLLAALAGSDITIRSVFGRSGSEAMAASPWQGAFSMVLRHGDPLTYFERGSNNADAEAAAYDKHLGGLTAARRAELAQLLRQLCWIGFGLAYRDAGRTAESRNAFSQVSRENLAITRADVIDILLD
jgi:hypothetical protein